MKLVLEKPWTWNDNALMYFDRQRPEMVNFPFWWYLIEGRNIQYIKQLTKNCGICYAENRWIEIDEQDIVNVVPKVDEEIDRELANEIERRSWFTLGDVVIDSPENQYVIHYASGGGSILTFHPVLKRLIKVEQCNSDGELIFILKVNYNEIEVRDDQKKLIETKYYKSGSTVRSKLYQCESNKAKEWTELPNGKFIKKWIFTEKVNGVWKNQTEKYESERRKKQYL